MINIQQGREEINSNGGNILIGALLQLENWKILEKMKTEKINHGKISNSDILKITTNLLALGRNDFCSIKLFKNDLLFFKSLGVENLPSEETLRQRLDDIAKQNHNQSLIDDCNVELLSKIKDYGTIETQYSSYIPLDLDVSVMLQPNCKKEGVNWTYHNANGYAPIFCHLGSNGYMLANELRNGSQHSSNGAIEFIKRCFDMTKKLNLKNKQLLLRADSAHDDKDFIKMLIESSSYFLVKRNPRSECKEPFLAIARRCGVKLKSREGKNVYRIILSHLNPEGLEDAPMFMVVEVTERMTDKLGNGFLFPEVTVSSWWTNLPEDEAVCIELYHNHATSEQFHSELKSDMNLERLPSGKFATNALILNLASLAFNCLRIIGQKSLEFKELSPIKLTVNRRRLRSVLQDLIHIGCKFTRHANRIIVKFGRDCPWYKTFEAIYAQC